MNEIREPYVSGSFYPRNPNVLRADIEGFLKKVPTWDPGGDIRGIVSPHAGYMYSGQIAAYGFKAISGRHYDTVVILAPSHRAFFLGAAVLEGGAYRTPLGLVDVDGELAGELLKNQDSFIADPKMHRKEHSIEVQIPFLQSVLRDFRILPLIMGTAQDPQSSLELADLIYEALKKREGSYLIVGSSDLSHYYPYGLAVQMDKTASDLMERFDTEGMVKELMMGKYEACGVGAILATMSLSKKLGATRAKVLSYKNSGDVSGEMSGVVGYVSCVFYGGK